MVGENAESESLAVKKAKGRRYLPRRRKVERRAAEDQQPKDSAAATAATAATATATATAAAAVVAAVAAAAAEDLRFGGCGKNFLTFRTFSHVLGAFAF